MNDATCVNTIGGYTCDCWTGYEGLYCEIGMFQLFMLSNVYCNKLTCVNTFVLRG